MKKILNLKALKYTPFLIILILSIILSSSYNTILNMETNYCAENNSLLKKYSIPTYTVPIVEKEPEIEVAPINDKEDGMKQNRPKDTRGSFTVNDIKQYETSGTSLGIDVSKYQGNINWSKVKQDGIDFAIIRVGYRGYGTGKIVMDPYFKKNIEGALANNIHVGIYFYSVAKNEMEALEEANFTINAIKNYNITYPVAFDLEDFNRHRLAGVSYDQLNKNAITFLNRIQSAGYTAMHYGSKSTFGPIWNMNNLNKYKVWLAHYTDKTTYAGKYNIWQYTSNGIVSGISGRLDLNIAYFRLSTNASDQAKDDSEVSLDPNAEAIKKVTFSETNEQVVTVGSAIFRKSPSTELDNKISSIQEETIITRTGTSETWSRVTYQGQTGYILNSQLKIYEEPSNPEIPTEETTEQ